MHDDLGAVSPEIPGPCSPAVPLTAGSDLRRAVSPDCGTDELQQLRRANARLNREKLDLEQQLRSECGWREAAVKREEDAQHVAFLATQRAEQEAMKRAEVETRFSESVCTYEALIMFQAQSLQVAEEDVQAEKELQKKYLHEKQRAEKLLEAVRAEVRMAADVRLTREQEVEYQKEQIAALRKELAKAKPKFQCEDKENGHQQRNTIPTFVGGTKGRLSV